MIFAISSLPRLLKMMMSSMRFRNSGLKCARRVSRTLSPVAPDGNVRRHDDDGVLEIDGAAFAVGQSAIVEDLKHDVPDIRMRFFDLVQKNDGVGPATDALGQIAAFVVADVARRSSDQSRNGMLLHVFGHVDPDHRALVVEEKLGQSARRFGFTDAGRAEKHEDADRTIPILQSGAGTTNRIRDRLQCIVLADDTLRQQFFHANQFLNFAFEHLA